jgi:thiopeptide-type bacteriocin biosynthesis protein
VTAPPPKPSTYRPASRFVFRSPLLPFDTLTAWTGDLAALRTALRKLLDDPAVREAVFVASPELDGQIGSWLEQPDSQSGQGVERALVRYVSRMSGRATPFGLFSGVAVGKTGGPTTALALPPRSAYRRHTRLDNDYLFAACADLAREPALRGELRHRPNSSLYRAAGRLRYAESRMSGGMRTYHLVAVDPADYLLAVLERAAAGATPDDLVDVLCTDPEVTREEAAAFVDELIETQIVVPELAPPVTGIEPTHRIVEQLRGYPAGAAAASVLEAASRQIAAIDETPPGLSPDAYRAVAKTLGDGLQTKVEIARMFQVDLFKPTPDATLGGAVLDEISRALELVRKLTPADDGDSMQRFKQSFSNRYETREVPLVEVLDEEVGIGFGDADTQSAGAPLLADVAFPPRSEPRRVAMARRDAHLMRLVEGALRTGATEIVLTDDDLEQLSRPQPSKISDAVAVSASIAAESPEAIAEGRFFVKLHGVDGGPGARLLGRFCHGSADVTALTAEICAAEHAHRSDALFAEIVHLPEGRIGNILLRPVLREYEIVYLGTSGIDAEHQIPVTDLLVSVQGGRVVLRSKKLGREVLPRMTTAHNYSARSLGVYRFLCSLAQQEGRGAGWSWGIAGELPFLPRLRRGRIVLQRARWNLGADELDKLDQASKGSNAAKTPDQIRALRSRQVAAVTALREARRLPRWIVCADGDNELPIDLDNPLMVESFAQLVKGRQSATIYELFPGPDLLCASGPEGRFTHEIVVPFLREPEPKETARRLPPLVETEAPRRFVPGSQWLFFKIYTGTATADVLLREAIAPVIRSVIDDGLADSWFFIRYGDPDHHLRLRFAGDPQKLLGGVMPRVHEALAPLVDAGLLWRLVVDTYEREVERYGGPAGIGPSEALFSADSQAVLAIVEASSGDAGADAAWRLALRGIDRLLDDLGFDLAGKLRVMTTARDNFGTEFGLDTAFQRRLGDKFRKHKAEIADVLDTPDDAPDHPLAPGFAALAARSVAQRQIGEELRRLQAAGALTSTVDEIVGSYIHMHCNRILSSAQRSQELVLYDLLRRHYDGLAARARQQAKKPV